MKVRKDKIKLVCFDMNGVIFKNDNFWLMLHKKLGTFKKGKLLTEKYVNSDYDRLVEEVVNKLWKGKSAKPYYLLIEKSRYVSGAKSTISELKKRGLKTAIISSGPMDLAKRAQTELGIDYVFTNTLVIKRNLISGEFFWPIGHDNKAKIVRQLGRKLNLSMKDIAFVGEGVNDISVARIAGISISFNSKSKELDEVCHVVIREKNLTKILQYV